MIGKFFDSVYDIYISDLKMITFVTVKDIFDLENEKFNIFSPFLMIFDKNFLNSNLNFSITTWNQNILRIMY